MFGGIFLWLNHVYIYHCFSRELDGLHSEFKMWQDQTQNINDNNKVACEEIKDSWKSFQKTCRKGWLNSGCEITDFINTQNENNAQLILCLGKLPL